MNVTMVIFHNLLNKTTFPIHTLIKLINKAE